MYYNKEALNKYKSTTEFTTTRKTKQVVMLYDGIVKFLTLTKDAIQQNNAQERFNNSEKASKIISGLHSCLDPENGKEITKILDNFYSGIFIRIMNLNFEKNQDINYKNCCQIIEEIKSMRSAWLDVDEKFISESKVEDSFQEGENKKTKSNDGSFETLA